MLCWGNVLWHTRLSMFFRRFLCWFYFAKDEPHIFMFSFKLRLDFFKLFVRFELVLLPVVALIVSSFWYSKQNLIAFRDLVRPRRNNAAMNKVSRLFFSYLTPNLWLVYRLISIKSMTKLFSMPEALRLERKQFVISDICKLWKDEELIVLILLWVAIAQVVIVVGRLCYQIDERSFWLMFRWITFYCSLVINFI